MTAYVAAPLVPLETPRLHLRPLTAADAPRIQRLFSDPDVLRYMDASIPHPYPSDGAEQFLRQWLPRIERREVYAWALVEKLDPEAGLIGQISLTPTSDRDHRGFWLGKAYWGRGLMREAAAAVNDFAFDVLEMPYLLLNNAEPNIASHRLKESAGAVVLERHKKEFIGGTFGSVHWKLMPEAWRASRLRES